jgi:hypothetical protein
MFNLLLFFSFTLVVKKSFPAVQWERTAKNPPSSRPPAEAFGQLGSFYKENPSEVRQRNVYHRTFQLAHTSVQIVL